MTRDPTAQKAYANRANLRKTLPNGRENRGCTTPLIKETVSKIVTAKVTSKLLQINPQARYISLQKRLNELSEQNLILRPKPVRKTRSRNFARKRNPSTKPLSPVQLPPLWEFTTMALILQLFPKPMQNKCTTIKRLVFIGS